MFQGPLLTTVDASAVQTSSAIDTASATWGSFQFRWDNLTAAVAVSAVVTLEVSDDGGVKWVPKQDATYTITTANGVESFSLNNVVTANLIRLVYTPSDVTGGTMGASATIKGLS